MAPNLKGLRLLLIPAALGAVMVLGACGTIGTPAKANDTTPAGNTSTPTSQNGASFTSGDIAKVLAEVRAAGGASFSSAGYPGGAAGQTGIHVTGLGVATVKPDLAVVNLGVQATAKTVADARQQAATAMDKVMKALKDLGIADKDIKTQWFNINPRYEYRNAYVCPDQPTTVPAPADGREPGLGPYPVKPEAGCYQTGESVLVGYDVTNQIEVKVRDLDKVSDVIDDAATAAGDLVRMNGVSFTLDNPKAIEISAREAAVKDALAKAQQFADLTGVKLGKLAFISENGGYYPLLAAEARSSFDQAGAAKGAPTPINPGTLDVTISVTAVFNIE